MTTRRSDPSHSPGSSQFIHRLTTSPLLTMLGVAFLVATQSVQSAPQTLYSQKGTDVSFAEVLASGMLPKGRNSKGGVTGSTIHVNKSRIEIGPFAKRPIPKAIAIHTLGNSVIPRKDFSKWTRWYQEDGNTQIFRLFKGETNVRNERPLSARVEAFSRLHWTKGPWHEWSGTYTIIKPHGAAIFQVKNGGPPNWAVQILMNDDGDVIFSPRHAKKKTIAKHMTGKPFQLRIRDNGHDFEVYLNEKKVGTGSWPRPEGTTGFSWGIYLGEHPVRHDAMLFVTGATFE